MKKILAVICGLTILTAGIFAQEAVATEEKAPVAETTVTETPAPEAAVAETPIESAEASVAETVEDDFSKKAAETALEAGKATAEFAVDATVDALKSIDFPTGSWIDAKWDAEWVMDVAKVILYDATTGDLIYTFTEENTTDWKFTPSDDGVSLSFACAETHRAYKFTKPYNLDKDLEMLINPDWTDEDYKVVITFKSLNK